jgi:DNA gyrase/topoisomerase IV subunit B
VDGAVRPALENWLNENPSVAEQIVGRIVMAARAREASRAAAQQVTRKTAVSHRLNLPGKLADCASTDPSRASSSSSRATRRAARPSRGATAARRRSCRCAARS